MREGPQSIFAITYYWSLNIQKPRVNIDGHIKMGGFNQLNSNCAQLIAKETASFVWIRVLECVLGHIH
jgi:hypothetical protein